MRDATFENALAFAQDLIRIPSPPGKEGEVANRILQEYEALGFEQARIDAMGNVIGVVPGNGGAPSVMLNAHLDVVAEGDPDEWEYPPFGAVVADGCLHGRGAMDIKGPLAIQTYAAAALRGRAPGDVVVAHTVLEERGGWGMAALLETGEVAPAAVIIGESTQGDITIGHRGRAEIEVVIRGLAGHASVPERARNPVYLLPAVLGAVQALAADQPSNDILGAASLATTGVEVRPESRNVIPDEVVVTLDWRVLPDATEEGLLGRVRSAVSEAIEAAGAHGADGAHGAQGADGAPEALEGLSVEVRMSVEAQTTFTGRAEDRKMFGAGFLVDADHPVARAAAVAVGQREDPSKPATIRPWQFATDGGWSCTVHGIPTIGFAPGQESYAHTNRERLDLEEARWSLARYPGLIVAVQEALR